jgi:hypothetical protein
MARSRTKRLWVLSIAGGSALLVAGALAASWPLVLARYRLQRLDQALTFAEARPWLDLLAADGAEPGGGGALLSSLGGSRPRLTAWFFQGVVEGALPDVVVEAFARRVAGDEALLASWSHYVRWAMGDELWGYLTRLSGAGAGAEEPAGLFPCVTTVDGTGLRVRAAAVSQVTFVVHDHKPAKRLEGLALAWFLGMTPLPLLDGSVEDQLAAWLRGARPFLRHLVHDDALGRCKRETEFEPLPTLTPFSERGLPVPQAPLPEWKGQAPERPSAGGGAPSSNVLVLPPPRRG